MNSGICHSSKASAGGQRHGQDRVEAAQHEGHRRRGDRGDQQRMTDPAVMSSIRISSTNTTPVIGAFEDRREGGSRAAAQQQRRVFVVEARQPSDVRTDGRTREHDRGLGTHRAAESDGRRTAHDRGPAVVPGDARVAARHGVEDARHAFGDVVADDVFDEQRRQDDAHGGVDQEKDMGAVHREPAYQPALDAVQQHFEQVGSQPCEHTDHHGQQHHDLLVGESPGQPEEFEVDAVGAEGHLPTCCESEMLGLSGDQFLVVEIVDFHGCTNVRQGFGSRGAGLLRTFAQDVVHLADAGLVVVAALADRVEHLVENGDQQALHLHVAQPAAAVVRFQLLQRGVFRQISGKMLGAAESVEVGEHRVAFDLARVLHAQVVGIGVHAHHLFS